MNGRMYDPLLGRFLSPDPFVPNPYFTQDFNRYMYARNNPLKYIDPDGEFVITATVTAIGIGILVGGTINVVSNWSNISNFWQGLSFFGVGGLGGGLVAAFPGAALYIAGGTSALNSILQQGFDENVTSINWGQVTFSGAMGMATTYFGGQLGQAIGVDKWFSGVNNNLLRNWLQSTTTNTIVGGTFGGIFGGLSDDPNTNFWSGAWDGIKIGAITGTISAIGNTAQYSIDNKVGFLSGKSNNVSSHAQQRVVERNVSQSDVNNALKNPLKVTETQIDVQGRPSVKYIGRNATVTVNPETGKIITVYPTSTQRVNSLLKLK